MERATAKMLIAKKLQGDYDKIAVKAVDLPAHGFSLELRKPELGYVLNALDSFSDDASTADNVRFMSDIVYKACPMLHDKELQEAFDCKEPTEIVMAILGDDFSALGTLATEVMKFYGMGNLVDAIKN